VSTPNPPMRTHSAAAQQLTSKVAQRWVQAGDQSDCAEGLGIDGRITLVHDLCDFGMKGWALLAECLVSGPGAWFGTSCECACKPLPSEPIEVPATTYSRQIEAVGPFVRVGMPNISVPVSAIAFQPASLPPGATQFQVVLTNYDYLGANYTGTIRLSTQAVNNVAAVDKVVTVGL
jgi:hypothetical protein